MCVRAIASSRLCGRGAFVLQLALRCLTVCRPSSCRPPLPLFFVCVLVGCRFQASSLAFLFSSLSRFLRVSSAVMSSCVLLSVLSACACCLSVWTVVVVLCGHSLHVCAWLLGSDNLLLLSLVRCCQSHLLLVRLSLSLSLFLCVLQMRESSLSRLSFECFSVFSHPRISAHVFCFAFSFSFSSFSSSSLLGATEHPQNTCSSSILQRSCLYRVVLTVFVVLMFVCLGVLLTVLPARLSASVCVNWILSTFSKSTAYIHICT